LKKTRLKQFSGRSKLWASLCPCPRWADSARDQWICLKNDGELDSSFFSIGGFKTKKGKGIISRPKEGAEMQLLNIQVGGRTNDSSAFLFADGTQTPGLKVSIDDSMLTDFSGKKELSV